MCVCVYVYIHTQLHPHSHTHTYIYTHIRCIHVCVCVCIYIHTATCTLTHIYIHTPHKVCTRVYTHATSVSSSQRWASSLPRVLAAVDVGACARSGEGFLWTFVRGWECWIPWQLCFRFLRRLLPLSPLLHQVHTPTNSIGGFFFFSALSPGFIICRPCNGGRSDWFVVIPYCSFDLHVSND